MAGGIQLYILDAAGIEFGKKRAEPLRMLVVNRDWQLPFHRGCHLPEVAGKYSRLEGSGSARGRESKSLDGSELNPMVVSSLWPTLPSCGAGKSASKTATSKTDEFHFV